VDVEGGELTALTWDDIDLNSGSVIINKTTQYVKGLGIIEKETKTPTSDRKLYISSTTLKILKRYKFEQEKQRFKLGNKWQNSNRIFTTIFGGDIHPDTPSKIFKKVRDKYNLRYLKFHGLRHTAISLLIRDGIQAQVISKKSGHSSLQVLHRYI